MSVVSMTCQMRAKSALHVLKLALDGLQPPALLVCQSVHLLVEDIDEASDMLPSVRTFSRRLRTMVSSNELGTDSWRSTGTAALLEDGLADVVCVLSALGL